MGFLRRMQEQDDPDGEEGHWERQRIQDADEKEEETRPKNKKRMPGHKRVLAAFSSEEPAIEKMFKGRKK